ncbi:MAG: orotate phosphoribosyltransferase [Alicyclobacillus sp.]|nr:orotate phosphoribosyltransferase [Alicyclobacillus sp.]
MEQQGLLPSPLDVSRPLAAGLLQIRAVELRPQQPFTWSSGWKSPMYCDNRLILSYPVVREWVLRGLRSVVETHCPGVDLIAGAATGGIAHAAMLADRLGLASGYVRSSAKSHGTQRLVEGRTAPGMRAVVVEDTLSTGRSAYDAAAALQAEGVHVLAVLTIFSYDFAVARQRALDTGIPAFRLLTFDTLVEVAAEQGYIRPDEVELLLAWRRQPERYGAEVAP